MSKTWRTIHVPSVDLPHLAKNGLVTERGEDGLYRVRIVHSRRQTRELFERTAPTASESDLAFVRDRLAGSCLPEESSSAAFTLGGPAAKTCCRAVLTLNEPTTDHLRSLIAAGPGMAIKTYSDSGHVHAFILAAGGPIPPTMYVCYSRVQALDALRPICTLMGDHGIWDYRALERQVRRGPLPRKSARTRFQAEEYAGAHLLLALKAVLIMGYKDESVETLFA